MRKRETRQVTQRTIRMSIDQMQIGMTFVEADGTLYKVLTVHNMANTPAIYGCSTSDKPSGWFIRKYYDVLIR